MGRTRTLQGLSTIATMTLMVILTSFLFSCGGDESDSIDSDEQLLSNEQIAQRWMSGDESVAQFIRDDEHLQSIIKVIETIESKDSKLSKSQSLQLPSCSGYWGNEDGGGWAPYLKNTGQYRFYWSPNCSFPAPEIDCGADRNDNMVSIWMGPDFSAARSYRVDGATYAMRLYLYQHTYASFRQYRNVINGRTYGNAYVCIANWMNPGDLRFGRIY